MGGGAHGDFRYGDDRSKSREGPDFVDWAVAVKGEEILVGDSLELIIKSEASHDPEVIAIHGITPEEVKNGVEPEEAIKLFLDYIGGGYAGGASRCV